MRIDNKITIKDKINIFCLNRSENTPKIYQSKNMDGENLFIITTGVSGLGKTTCLRKLRLGFEELFPKHDVVMIEELVSDESGVWPNIIEKSFGEIAFSVASVIKLFENVKRVSKPTIFLVDRTCLDSIIYDGIHGDVDRDPDLYEKWEMALTVATSAFFSTFPSLFKLGCPSRVLVAVFTTSNIEKAHKIVQTRGNWDTKFGPDYIVDQVCCYRYFLKKNPS